MAEGLYLKSRISGCQYAVFQLQCKRRPATLPQKPINLPDWRKTMGSDNYPI
jgi:hypothetical protein